ncbi:zinc-dependent peptidase [Flavobacteriaceae bacterium XHP0103]|uniref:zinc-dependent peptidase n=1 Tax=Marixanthotalea marina TaxID=2844359 RepID=UPI002989A846|nr:zinc-dependent peptidase [Marixanthotalea marina]MBU3821921.1 zinc-dependent peptidase [Marixanthotalea marina]
MHNILSVQQNSFGGNAVIWIFVFALLCMVLFFIVKMIDTAYVIKHKKPFFVHLYPFLRKLEKHQKTILTQKFRFYNRLTAKQRRYFEHRVASFIKDKDFIGRGGCIVTEEMKVLISATAVMLTFGFRDFYIGLISKIVIYPERFYSKTNEKYHKGEFNPKLETLVLSWEDFEQGFDVENDNLNLGIHEFTHAIHLNSIKERDISSTIFSDSFQELASMLSSQDDLRDRLVSSKYFRKYAFTNQFEFLAVAIENFIETPQDFKSEFPEVYGKVKQMLNFNISGY